MNSKNWVFIIFAAWSALCWRWYVCEIKQVCPSSDVGSSASMQPSDKTGIEDPNSDSAVIRPMDQDNANALANNKDQANAVKPDQKDNNGATASRTESDINSVEFEEVENRMTIRFPYKSTIREQNGYISDYLSRLAERLIKTGERVSITGHTDFVGEPKDNLQFGLQRANSIKSALVKKGVPSKQIKCYSKGDTKPVATNDTPLGRYKNRRVEIVINKK